MSILPIKLQDYQPAQSASALAKAIQTFNLFQDDLATEVIGFFLVGPCTRVIGINALFEGALDSAESVAVTLSKIDQDTGAATTIMTALAFTDANTPAGTQDFSDNLLPAASTIRPGDILRLSSTYVPGAGPNNPHMNLTVQAGI